MSIGSNAYVPPYGNSGFQMPIPGSQQVVIPQITIPTSQPFAGFQSQPQSLSQAVDLYRVKDMDGAKQFQMTPNSRVALFKEDDDVMYIKQTDNNNYPISLKRYRFYEEEEPAPEAPPEYATKEDLSNWIKANDDRFSEIMASFNQGLDSLREEIANGKQSVRSASSNAGIKRSTAANE